MVKSILTLSLSLPSPTSEVPYHFSGPHADPGGGEVYSPISKRPSARGRGPAGGWLLLTDLSRKYEKGVCSVLNVQPLDWDFCMNLPGGCRACGIAAIVSVGS